MDSPPPPTPHQNTSVIPQFDGNCSFLTTSSKQFSNSSLSLSPLEESWFSQISRCDMDQPSQPHSIPVITGFRQAEHAAVQPRPPVRKVLRRENKCLQAMSLPIIISYNMRSICGNLKSFANDVKERVGEVIS